MPSVREFVRETIFNISYFISGSHTVTLVLPFTHSQTVQGFPQDKIIAGCCVFIAGHMAISGLIFSIF